MLKTLQRAHPTIKRADFYQRKAQFLQRFPESGSCATTGWRGSVSHRLPSTEFRQL